MTEQKKRSMVPMVISVMLFVVGLVLGYYIWGYKESDKIDYREVLQETINYIATLEHKNKTLRTQVDELETEVSMAKQKQTTSADQREGEMENLSERIAALEKENRDLRTAIDDNAQLARQNQELKEKIRALSEEMNTSEAMKPAFEEPAAPASPPMETNE